MLIQALVDNLIEPGVRSFLDPGFDDELGALFIDATGQAISTLITSVTILPTGIADGETLSLSTGAISIDGAAFEAGPVTWNTGDTIAVQITTSSSYETAVEVVVTASGSWTDTFTVTTMVESVEASIATMDGETVTMDGEDVTMSGGA